MIKLNKYLMATLPAIRCIFSVVRCRLSDARNFLAFRQQNLDNRQRKRMPLLSGPLSIILLAFILYGSLSAQTTDSVKVYKKLPYKTFAVGLKAGINVAQIFGIASQGINHFGFAGGVRFSYRFHDQFSFDPEVLYDMKGAARYANPDKGDYDSYFVDLDYIEVPIIFNFHFGKRRNFSFEFGPSIGFLVREKVTVNGGVVTSPYTNFHVYDISFLVGLNYNLPKGFGLNLRYMNSIAPIQNTNSIYQSGAVGPVSIGQLNTVINFSVNYMFGYAKPVVLKNGTIEGTVIKEKKKKKQKGDVIDEE